MLEKSVEAYLVNECKARGCVALKQGFHLGIPDRLVILPSGDVVWVELKRPEGRPSAVQRAVMRRLQKMNHSVFIAYSKADVDDVMDIIDKKIVAYKQKLRKKIVKNWKGKGDSENADDK